MDTFGLYLSGNKVTDKPEILFARMDIKEVMAKVEEMQRSCSRSCKPAEEAAEDDGIDLEPKAEITYDDFAKLQFQIGEIVKCEAVPKSKKLLCSQVKNRNQDPPDRKRYQGSLLTRGNGRKESYGSNQLKAC